MATAERTIFISRAGQDAAIAEQIGAILTADGYNVKLQDWDFRNTSFINEMHEALDAGGRVVGVLSPEYLASDYCSSEWQAVLADDPLNRERRLILLKVAPCKPGGLLKPLTYWDLTEVRAEPNRLAAAVREAVRASHRPSSEPTEAALFRHPEALFDPDVLSPVPNFTGRERELGAITAAFGGGSAAVAIVGLPGAGKSELANEYARRNRSRYAAVWRLTANTESNVIDGLLRFGSAFIENLEFERERTAAAKYVLARVAADFAVPVLLLFDNVDDENVPRRWSPAANAHLLITTRLAGWWAGVEPVIVDVLPREEAIEYLERESGRQDLGAAAGEIADALDCLPLALVHAAAYLRRTRNVTANRYLERLEEHLSSAPAGNRGDRAVFATFQEAIARAEHEARGAAAVLCVASFFAPDSIPEELLRQQVAPPSMLRPALPSAAETPANLPETLGDPLCLDEALGALDRFSLITFHGASRSFSVHRLVQAVSASMAAGAVDEWQKFVLELVIEAFPNPEPSNWASCERLLPHALRILYGVSESVTTSRLSLLANNVARYLVDRASFSDAERLFRRALAIEERAYGADHPTVATALNNLADVLRATNRAAEAEPLFRRALTISETAHGADHPAVAPTLNNFALLLQETNRAAEAEPLLRRALGIDEIAHGPDHPTVARRLNNLADLLRATKRAGEAEPLFRRALAINETAYGADHPSVATNLSNLALLLQETNRAAEAEPFVRRALTIDETAYGTDHPTVATDLNNLARVLQETNRAAEAEPLFRRALAILQESYGSHHPTVAIVHRNIAELLRVLGRDPDTPA